MPRSVRRRVGKEEMNKERREINWLKGRWMGELPRPTGQRLGKV